LSLIKQDVGGRSAVSGCGKQLSRYYSSSAVSSTRAFSCVCVIQLPNMTEILIPQLSSIPNEIRKYSGDVAEYIDGHVDKLAHTIRDQLSNTSWLPDAIRPSPPPPPPSSFSAGVLVPSSMYERVQVWVSRHRVLTGFLVLTTGVVVYRSYRRSRFCRKTRKARRLRNGGRSEVVVIAGSPTLPLTRSLALDMERKGFIVYIVCNSMDDELLVQNLARPDIRPLTIDITDVSIAPGIRICRVSLIYTIAASKRRCLH